MDGPVWSSSFQGIKRGLEIHPQFEIGRDLF